MERIGLTPATAQPVPQQNESAPTPAEVQQDFAKMLTNAIDYVNEAEIEADVKTEQLVNNEINDLHEVMIAAEKAAITMQMTMEIRNKAIEAYQEMMKMPL